MAEQVPNLFSQEQITQMQRSDAAEPAAAPTPEAAPAPVVAAAPAPTPIPVDPVPDAPPAVPVTPAIGGNLSVSVALLSGRWPDPVKKEIAANSLGEHRVEVPFEVVEQGLKQGRLEFRWKQICQWMKPAPPAEMASASLDTRQDFRLEFPLNIIAPLFLQSRPKSQQKKANVATNIPDLFSATGPVENQAAPAEENAPAISAPAPAPSPVQPATPKRAPQTIAEIFGEPEKRQWTPNEIVQKTSQLTGVAGALIALQDGLLVASCVPQDLKTETVAAFLPQIFGRMNQYSKELKMGELKSVLFNVTGGTLQIFNAGIIYFAAVGRPDAPLPGDQLTIIANELSRHTK